MYRVCTRTHRSALSPRTLTGHDPTTSSCVHDEHVHTVVPLHRARAALSALIARCESEPITLTRNGRAVAVLVHPSALVTEGGTVIAPSARRAIKADLLHALAALDGV